MKIIITLLFLLCSHSYAANWNGKIIDVKNNTSLTLTSLAQDLIRANNVVLGEKHNTTGVQLAQATVIEAVVRQIRHLDFTVAWEFLNYNSQAETQAAFDQFVEGTITVEEFLKLTGNSSSLSYAPILEVTRDYGGKMLGVNISRKQKDPVVRGGIQAADPAVVPPDFAMGGKNYFERFSLAMQGHATSEQIQNYFAAQCLTDDVMAYHMLTDSNSMLRFLVVGSFHSDFFDGTVVRLKNRAMNQIHLVVRFIDASDYTESELLALPVDLKYGDLADYVYFVNEPKLNKNYF